MILCCKERSCGLGLLPLLFTVCSVVTIIITYSISVANGHVYPYLPTISDTGGTKPESNVFGFLLSVCGFLGFVVIMIRYYQYRFISKRYEDLYYLLCFNKIALLIGIVSSIGIIIVAAFQDRGVSGEMHVIGALSVFGCGIVYCFLQSYLSIRMLACGMNTKLLCVLRIIISTLALGFFISNQICSSYAWKEWDKNPHSPKNCTIPLWRPECPGFSYNVATNACEWLMALTLFSFFLTYYGEFNKVNMNFNLRHTELTMLIPFQGSDSSENESNKSFE